MLVGSRFRGRSALLQFSTGVVFHIQVSFRTMSVQRTFHSAGTNNLGFYPRATDARLQNLRVGSWISYNFLEQEGTKNNLHQIDLFTWQSLHLFRAEKPHKQWTTQVISRPHFQRMEAHPMRRNLSFSCPDTGFHLNSLTNSGNSPFRPFQGVVYHEGIRRRPPRPTEVDCSFGEKYPNEGKAWKDGPSGVVWNAEEIAQAANGEVVSSGSPGSISTDSRRISRGEWFLPLVGSNFDGHEFLPQALHRGCAGYIGRNVSTGWPRGFIRVDGDILRVLHKLAACVRRKYGGPVVGITGSTGKTTARAMTALALESLGPIHQTEGNFNNQIGLPLTLLKLPSTSSACVLEMGMSNPGEIRILAEIARPTVRVLLNVGPAHMKNFGSLDDVAEAKGEILREARPGDVCVLNADDPLVMNLPLPRGVRVVLFGRHEGWHVKVADAQATNGGHAVRVVLEQLHSESVWVENFSSGAQILEHLRENSTRSNISNSQSPRRTAMSYENSHEPNLMPRFHTSSKSVRSQGSEKCSSPGPKLVSRMEFEIPSPGLHLAINACAAAAVAVSLGVPLQNVGKSLSKYLPIGMRCRLEVIGGVQLINDSYNSNPTSLESGLNLLGSMNCEGRRVALLGDMLELGSISQKAHIDAVALCKRLKLGIVGLVGPSFSEAVASSVLHKDNCVFAIFKDSQELAAKVIEILRPGDVVLVKGSRGMEMEIAANAIRMMARLE